MNPTVLEKARNIQCLICDLDGVLTDGRLYYGEEGEIVKAFHCHDGVGLKNLMSFGIEVAIITTAKTPIVDTRMQALDITHVYTGKKNKLAAFEDLVSRLQHPLTDFAMIGDDLPDLPLFARCGLSVAVANANPAVKALADWTTHAHGGNGAVRELSDLILTAKGLHQQLIDSYRNAV